MLSSSKALARASSFALHSRQLQLRLSRRASTFEPPKPRVLEKPERFNPPSHGQRLKSPKKKVTYGAPLSEAQRAAQAKKQYPNMMPPEGSFMFWFLTNRMIHVYISLGILLSLVAGIWFQNFLHTTPYRDLLPPNSMFFAHPWQFLTRYVEVYGMHTEYNTKVVMERRKQSIEDVQRRSEYRKAHGLNEGGDAEKVGGWTAKSDIEVLGGMINRNMKSDRYKTPEEVQSDLPALEVPAAGAESPASLEAQQAPPKRKVWFGIW